MNILVGYMRLAIGALVLL